MTNTNSATPLPLAGKRKRTQVSSYAESVDDLNNSTYHLDEANDVETDEDDALLEGDDWYGKREVDQLFVSVSHHCI